MRKQSAPQSRARGAGGLGPAMARREARPGLAPRHDSTLPGQARPRRGAGGKRLIPVPAPPPPAWSPRAARVQRAGRTGPRPRRGLAAGSGGARTYSDPEAMALRGGERGDGRRLLGWAGVRRVAGVASSGRRARGVRAA